MKSMIPQPNQRRSLSWAAKYGLHASILTDSPGTRLRAPACGLFVLLALTVAAPARDFFVYFGTYSNALSHGIYVSRLDAATGKLSAPELAADTVSPCFLALTPDEKFLYADNSVRQFNGEKTGAVSSFAVDQSSGQLTFLNEKSSGGPGPCHVSVAAGGKVLLTANYSDGSVKSFVLAADGSIGADGTVFQNHGSGPNPVRQTAAHAHYITADPSGRFVLQCDLGLDRVMIYRLHGADATLATNATPFGSVPPGSGSRHLAFSRDGKFVHVINEMGCTITTFKWDANAGVLTPVETVSALPPGQTAQGTFTSAEILVHPTGKYVYATIRGHDSVSVFAADRKTGQLTFLQNLPSGGKGPRGLGIDPTGHWLFTGNQFSDNAVEFAIDTKTGMLTPTGTELKIGAPVDVKFVAVK